MIVCGLAAAFRYQDLNKGIAKALAFLAETDLTGATEGKYELDGDHLFYLVNDYATRAEAGSKLEGHRKYIDVQFVVSGSEMIGYAPLHEQRVYREYDTANDYALYEGEASFVTVSAGMVAIFFPEDLHMPGVGDGLQNVKKVVMKVKI